MRLVEARKKRGEREVAASVYVGGIRKSSVNRRSNACFLCASNKSRYSHTGPKLGPPARPPARRGKLIRESSDARASAPRNQLSRWSLKLSLCRCDSISNLYFGTPTFFNAAAGTRRARICYVLDTTQGMVPRRILIGPIAYFNPFRAKTPSRFRISL